MRLEIIKLTEGSIRKILRDLGRGKCVFGYVHKSRQTGLCQIKKLLHSKGSNQQSEEKTTELEKIF
jgi:hypothetical protein